MTPFPIKIPTLWRQAFPGLLIGALVGRSVHWVQGGQFHWPDTLPLMLIAAVFVVAMHLFQPTLCGPAGLKVMNTWGLRKAVAWADIVHAEAGRFYGLQPSLKLVDRQGRAYWIARDTKNLKGLHALCAQFGGPAHPLTRALETPLYQL